MDKVRSYRDLLVWQRAMDLTVRVYGLSRSFPKDEQFGLTSQVRRAASSIAANVAEGYGRATKPAYLNFLRIAQGSLKELETHMILAGRLGYAGDDIEEVLADAEELSRMLRALILKVEASPAR